MNLRTQQHAIAGGLIWVGLIAAIVFSVRSVVRTAPEAIGDLARHAVHQRPSIEVESSFNLPLKPGDPIYLDGGYDPKPVGMVQSTMPQDGKGIKFSVVMFANSPAITAEDYLLYCEANDSVDWMLRTMFHDRKKEELKSLIQNAVRDNREELIDAFKPLVINSLKEAGGLIREDIRIAFEARQTQLAKLGQRYQTEVLKEKLLPVFQEEVWSIIQAESQPLVGEISLEIWEEVSVFGFGWRYLYDRSPLPKKGLTEKKFNQFVDGKVKPIIAAHMEDVLVLQKEISAKVSKNEKVRHALNESFQVAVNDPELQKFMAEVLHDVLLDNSRLQEAMSKQWASSEAKQAFAVASEKLDPVVREIGISLFGTPDGGITPEFASVLRRRILHKDARWLTLKINDPAGIEDDKTDGVMPASLPLRISNQHSTAPVKLKRLAE